MMFRLFTAARKPAALINSALALGLLAPQAASAVSVSTTQLQLVAGDTHASLNGLPSQLDEPAAIVDGRFYVPAKWIADALDLSLKWDDASQTIRFLTPKAYIEINPSQGGVSVNGDSVPFQSVAEIRNGRLLVDLAWFSQYAELTYRYNQEKKSVELNHIGSPRSTYKESLLFKDDAQPNSKPVAIFGFGKQTYRLGEPIDYVDLSYDPDAEGLPDYEWTGKQEAFFKPGTYTVTLTVKDGKGNRSEPFSRTVKVSDDTYVSEGNYPLYFKQPGTLLNYKRIQSEAMQPAVQLQIQPSLKQPADRQLMISGSKRRVTEKGFLYDDKIAKQARLYPQYVNGTNQQVQFATILRNTSESKPVTVSTSRKAEVPVSIYSMQTSNKLIEDFLAVKSETVEDIVIQPGTAVFYKVSGEVAPGQSYQGVYDLQTDGEVSLSYAMISPGEQPYDLGQYKLNSLKDDFSPSYPISDTSWVADARGSSVPKVIRIGEQGAATLNNGTSTESTRAAAGKVLAGARYRIAIDVTGKTALVLHPAGGFVKGAVRVNGNVIPLPASGLTENDAILLHRTANREGYFEVELMAAGGGQSAYDLLLIPLETNK